MVNMNHFCLTHSQSFNKKHLNKKTKDNNVNQTSAGSRSIRYINGPSNQKKVKNLLKNDNFRIFLKPLTQYNSIFNSFVEISFNILLDHISLITIVCLFYPTYTNGF